MSGNSGKGSLEELVEGYQSARSAYIADLYLDELAKRSTVSNYRAVINQMKIYPKFHELHVSLYINEIANPEFSGLLEVITEFRKSFKDKDALEDFVEAEAKIRA